MGGNALKQYGTVRLPADRAMHIGGSISEALQTVLRGAALAGKCRMIPAYRSKADFGDMDILVPSALFSSVSRQGVAGLLTDLFGGPTPFSHNGDVTSYGVALNGGGVFQVDLIVAPEQHFDFSLSYFSYNDLGNLIGRVAHKMGLKFGHDGLWLPARQGNYLCGEVSLTCDFREALGFLGFDYGRWSLGFDGLEDIFRYVASGKRFARTLYPLEHANHKQRIRDRKRPTYTKFLHWLDERPELPDSGFVFAADKSQHLQEVFAAFPHAEVEYKKVLDAVERSRAVSEKLNGDRVREMTGLEGKALGALMKAIRERFSSKDELQAFVLGAEQAEIDDMVREVWGGISEA